MTVSSTMQDIKWLLRNGFLNELKLNQVTLGCNMESIQNEIEMTEQDNLPEIPSYLLPYVKSQSESLFHFAAKKLEFGPTFKYTANTTMELVDAYGARTFAYAFVNGIFIGVNGGGYLREFLDRISCYPILFQYEPNYPQSKRPFRNDEEPWEHFFYVVNCK